MLYDTVRRFPNMERTSTDAPENSLYSWAIFYYAVLVLFQTSAKWAYTWYPGFDLKQNPPIYGHETKLRCNLNSS